MYFQENIKQFNDASGPVNAYGERHLIVVCIDDIWRSAHKDDHGYKKTDEGLSGVLNGLRKARANGQLRSNSLDEPVLLPDGLILFIAREKLSQDAKESITNVIKTQLGVKHNIFSDYTLVEKKWNQQEPIYKTLADAIGALKLKRPNSGSWVEAPDCSTHLALASAFNGKDQNSQLTLYYQPLFDRQKQLIGAEALIRWIRDGKTIAPDSFMYEVEQLRLLPALDGWVVEQAVKDIRGWLELIKGIDFKISINITPPFIGDRTLINRLRKEKREILERLEIEILEGYDLAASKLTANHVQELHNLGVSIALDDFGTGQSNYASLEVLPNDPNDVDKKIGKNKIKIDQRFVREKEELGFTYRSYVCETVATIGKRLNITVAIEGIENEEAYDRALRHNAISVFQGYYFSKALSRDEFQGKYL